MGTEFHWITGPWPGKLALAARPRGGDWLKDEIADWHHSGVDTVLSLLSPDEEQTLELEDEGDTVSAQDMDFISLPIPGPPSTGFGNRAGGGSGKSEREALSGKKCFGSLQAGSWPYRASCSMPADQPRIGSKRGSRDHKLGAWRSRSGNKRTTAVDRSLRINLDKHKVKFTLKGQIAPACP